MGETTKVRFKQRAVLGSGVVVGPGEEAEIPEEHFDHGLHERVEAAAEVELRDKPVLEEGDEASPVGKGRSRGRG